MNILGINGSPRIGGNTDILLDRVLEGARKAGAGAEKITLSNLAFSPCLECEVPEGYEVPGKCEELKDNGCCILEDDMRLIYKKIKDSDALVVASPIFFGSISAQTKMMIDRFQCTWRAKYILKKDLFRKRKKGAFISVSASDRKDFFDNAKMVIRNFFATVNVEYKEELFCPGVEKKGYISKHGDFLKKAYKLGLKIAETEAL